MFDFSDVLGWRHVDIVTDAIVEGRLEFHIQGVHEAGDPRRTLYGECLARLRRPDGWVSDAGEFVPPLEAAGDTPILDRHMLSLVLDRLERDPGAVLGCNLSASNLADAAAWEQICGQIRARSRLASRLVLELTEARAFQNLPQVARMIDQVRELGCRMALDDFGIGFASPSLLQFVGFDIVKIDKCFLHDIRPSRDGRDSLEHIIGFASCFAPVVAVEGVETEAQAALARMAGATHLQGYLFRARAEAPTS